MCDGQRAADVGFFKNKPLSEIASVDEQVTVAARSIVGSSGAGLKPAILELQAVVVALCADGFPDGVPRPTK